MYLLLALSRFFFRNNIFVFKGEAVSAGLTWICGLEHHLSSLQR